MQKSKSTIEAERKAIRAIVGPEHRLTHRQHGRYGGVWGHCTWTIQAPSGMFGGTPEAQWEKLQQHMQETGIRWEYRYYDENGKLWIA